MTFTRVLCLAVPAVLMLSACGSSVDPVALPGSTSVAAPAAPDAAGGGVEEPGVSSEPTDAPDERTIGADDPTDQAEDPTVGLSEDPTDEPTDGPADEPTEEPGPVPEPGRVATPESIEAAAAGLAGWLEANRPDTPSTSTDLPGCPALDLAVLQAALDSRGLTDELQDWGTEIEWNEYEDLDPDLMGIVCGGDSDGDVHDSGTDGTAAGVAVVDLGDIAWTEFLPAMGLEGLSETTIASMPGDAVADCTDGLCLAAWHADGLVVVVMVDGVPGLAEQDITDLFDELGPTVLATLAAA